MQSNNDLEAKDNPKKTTLLGTEGAVFWIQEFYLRGRVNKIEALALDNKPWQHLFDGDEGERNIVIFQIIDLLIDVVGKQFEEADLSIVKMRLREWVDKQHIKIEELVSKKQESTLKNETEMKTSNSVQQYASSVSNQNISQPKSLDETPPPKLSE